MQISLEHSIRALVKAGGKSGMPPDTDYSLFFKILKNQLVVHYRGVLYKKELRVQPQK